MSSTMTLFWHAILIAFHGDVFHGQRSLKGARPGIVRCRSEIRLRVCSHRAKLK